MKRRMAIFGLAGMILPGVASRALAAAAADDALSIDNNQKFIADYSKQKGVIVRPSGLMFRIIQNGFGKRPQPTDSVKVYYTGKLINGVIFDRFTAVPVFLITAAGLCALGLWFAHALKRRRDKGI